MRTPRLLILAPVLAAGLYAQVNRSYPNRVSVTTALPAGGNTVGNVNAIQSGTWTMQPGNTANTTPWLVRSNSERNMGAVAPGQATLVGGVSSGNLTGIVACDSSANLTMSAATTTQIVARQPGKAICICGFVINAGGTTTARLVHGTGNNCGTGQASITPPFNLVSGTVIAYGGGLGYVAKTPPAHALCVTNSAARTANVFVSYTQI